MPHRTYKLFHLREIVFFSRPPLPFCVEFCFFKLLPTNNIVIIHVNFSWNCFHVQILHLLVAPCLSTFEQSQGFFAYTLGNHRATVVVNENIFLEGGAIHDIVLLYVSMNDFELMEQFYGCKYLSLVQIVRLSAFLHRKLDIVLVDNQIKAKQSRELRPYF